MDKTVDAIAARARTLTGPLVPLLPPKRLNRQLPVIASRSASSSPFGQQQPSWHCQTFILPAAFPRSIPSSTRRPRKEPQYAGPAPKIDLKQALLTMFDAQTGAAERQVDVSDKSEVDNQEQLYVSVNRYTPTKKSNGPQGLTLVFAHANGFHKETWEATIADLLNDLQTGSAVLPIDEIWSLDAVNQGDAGVLNEETLGQTFNWADNGRDILNFILSYIDSPDATHAESSSTASFLSANPASDSSLYKLDTLPAVAPGSYPPSARTFKDRLIVGIGHSLGGGGMGYAASALPSLFSSVILVDPVLTNRIFETQPLTSGAITRRDTWKSKQEAMEGFLKKAFFRSWDSRVLERYVEFGTRETDGNVKLKGSARQEAIVFSDPLASASRRAFTRLSSIPGSLPVHFVFAEEGRSVLPEPSIKALFQQIPHATFGRVQGAGHLVAQEKPKETAVEIAKFLRRVYPLNESKL